MNIKLFVTWEIQYFEPGIFSFNSCVYYLSRGFITSTHAFNLLTGAFKLPTRAFSTPTRAFNLATRAFSLLTCGFELVTRGFELVTLTCNSCFTFPQSFRVMLLGRIEKDLSTVYLLLISSCSTKYAKSHALSVWLALFVLSHAKKYTRMGHFMREKTEKNPVLWTKAIYTWKVCKYIYWTLVLINFSRKSINRAFPLTRLRWQHSAYSSILFSDL